MGDFLLTILIIIFLLALFAIAIVVLTTCISIPLLVIDWLVFQVWLGGNTHKYDRFYELSKLWLTWSYRLPFKMSERGAKYACLGVGLMLVSPAAVVTYTAAYYVLQICFPFPIGEKEVPYKTHEDFVAITNWQDFPAFTYSHNQRDGWSGGLTIYYDFDQSLSAENRRKLDTLCDDPDNYLWRKTEEGKYILQRGDDGKYIKPSLKGGQITLVINESGFVITQTGDCPIRIEDFAERDSLNKNTGVIFPDYKVVNYHGEGWCDYTVTYYLLLEKKPSKQFINQLEHSSKWTKNEDGTYSCKWDENGYEESITVDKNSRVVMAQFMSW